MATQLTGPVMPIRTVSCSSCCISLCIHFLIRIKMAGNACDWFRLNIIFQIAHHLTKSSHFFFFKFKKKFQIIMPSVLLIKYVLPV